MTKVWPRGSEWRRWDLHVHTPDSFDHQFGSWDEYREALRAVEGVSVLGVTDYFFIDGYRKIRELRNSGDLSNFDAVLPNIELRLGTFVPKRSDGTQLRRLNFHVIFSDDVSPDVIEQQFIQALQFQVDGHPEDNRGTRNVTRQAIEDVGRRVKQHQSSFANDSDFVAGSKVITFDLKDIGNVLQRECFEGRYLLFLAAENWDQISWSGQDYLVRKNLLQSAHGLFCGQPSTIAWCLGRHQDMNEEAFKSEFRSLKPCVHGSDAHAIPDLCKPKDDKFCWIKADPTFEGLRQIVYEPADRVHIGPSAPLYHDEARVLTNVVLSDAAGWFDDQEIPLNPGLVSIIGRKGSGKSALAEIVAHAAASSNAEETGSFLRRAGSYLDEVPVTLTWADGTSTKVRLGDEQSGERKVRYLSQKFVERLCAEDRMGDELVREIEGVIFACTDPTETLNASDFAELRAIRTDGIRGEAQRLQENIVSLIGEESALRENLKKLPEKRARINTLQDEETGLVKQMPKPATEEEKLLQKELQQRRSQLTAIQQSIAADRAQLQKLTDIKTRISAFKSRIAGFESEIDSLLKEAGIPDAERDAFHPAFAKDTEGPLARKKAALEAEIKEKEGAGDRPADGTLRWLEAQIKRLSEKESADKARHNRIKSIQTRIAAITVEVKRIRKEVMQIEGPENARMEAAYKERLDAYAGYFRVLQDEQKALEELYGPVKARLAGESGSEQQLDFSIRWHADLDAWLKRGSALFDQRRTLPYGTFSDLSKAAQQILAPAWSSGDPERIRNAHEGFLEEFKKGEPKHKDYLRSDVTQQALIEWLYDVTQITLDYGLKYNGVDLEKLSPGTKGIVLLILYLGLDTVDTRPLIVDQPDENLDNESIYELLMRYFRDAKNRRQIILITHNPNLVVNADSEQVIIASCVRRDDGLPHISYVSGSLENTAQDDTGIREQTCRILEGGTDAFRRRELRYSLPSAK
jgi:putative AbiEii toxin of type IV toxin-antitoxin system/AAA domain-containing protein